MLFDLESDPQELVDLGASVDHDAVRTRMKDALFAWARQHHNRITVTPERVDHMLANREPPGIVIGFWDEAEYEAALGRKYGDWS
jgi:hypothetical protein